MRRWCLAAASAVACIAAGVAQAVETPVKLPCFDLAVIVAPESEEGTATRSDDPNVIILDARYHWKYKIERHFAGEERRSQIDVFGFQHVGFNRRIKHFLLFLSRKADGSYERLGLKYRLVLDDRRDFVIPFTEPLSPDELESGYVYPANYEQLLRPIQYCVADAWWFSATYLDPGGDNPIQAANHPWGRVEKTGVVADRSLRVTDLVNALADRRCPAK